MKNITEQLLEYKKQIEQAKSNLSKTEGRLEQMMEELQNKFECKTIKQAQIKLNNLENEIREKKQELEQLTRDFETEYSERIEG